MGDYSTTFRLIWHIQHQEEKDQFLCIMNSYLGILNPGSKNTNGNGLYKTYRLRRKMINRHLSGWWCNWVGWANRVGTGHALSLHALSLRQRFQTTTG